MILGERGYLAGKTATCYPGFEAHLKGALLPQNKVCHDGNVITAAGAGAAMEFALTLVCVLFGEKNRRKSAVPCWRKRKISLPTNITAHVCGVIRYMRVRIGYV